MSIYKKLSTARIQLQAKAIKKSGNNKFAGYTYMELSDFMPAVNSIFDDLGMCGVVNFDHEMASLTIIDTDSPESRVVFTSPMSTAALKGCHEVQNLGAVQTYLRRYLYVMALEIVEHDALDSTQPVEVPAAKVKLDPKILKTIMDAKSLEELSAAWNAIPVGIRKEYSQAKDAVKERLNA